MKEEMIKCAYAAMKNAYAPYSKFRVGACVLCYDGSMFYGTNVENASYGLTNCAERTAIFSAIANGKKKADIHSIAVVSESEHLITPCGACRQVFSECLDPNTVIYLSNGKKEAQFKVKDLLPYSFSSEDIQHV